MAALCSRLSGDVGVIHLLRCLIFVEAKLVSRLIGEYVDICSNHLG